MRIIQKIPEQQSIRTAYNTYHISIIIVPHHNSLLAAAVADGWLVAYLICNMMRLNQLCGHATSELHVHVH